MGLVKVHPVEFKGWAWVALFVLGEGVVAFIREEEEIGFIKRGLCGLVVGIDLFVAYSVHISRVYVVLLCECDAMTSV